MHSLVQATKIKKEILKDSDGKIILKCIFKLYVGGINWIDVAQEEQTWRPLMNAEKKLRFL
jgi:hypothetical protein